MTGLPKCAGQPVRQRASSPKLQVINTALMSAQSGYTFEEARADRHEVAFVVKARRLLTAMEVKSGAARETQPGMAAFAAAFKPGRSLLVGGDGIPLGEFLSEPVEHWVT